MNELQSELAIERTKLSNRRTLLAYIRSVVALIVAGAGLLKFIQDPVWIVAGAICIVLAPIILILGIMDYFRMKKIIVREQILMNSLIEPEENVEE